MRKKAQCSDTVGLSDTMIDLYTQIKNNASVGVQGSVSDNYSAQYSQCSQETVLVILECLLLHDQIRAHAVVCCTIPLFVEWRLHQLQAAEVNSLNLGVSPGQFSYEWPRY